MNLLKGIKITSIERLAVLNGCTTRHMCRLVKTVLAPLGLARKRRRKSYRGCVVRQWEAWEGYRLNQPIPEKIIQTTTAMPIQTSPTRPYSTARHGLKSYGTWAASGAGKNAKLPTIRGVRLIRIVRDGAGPQVIRFQGTGGAKVRAKWVGGAIVLEVTQATGGRPRCLHVAKARAAIVQRWQELRAQQGKRGAVDRVTNAYLQELARTGRRISRETLYNWHRAWRAYGVDGLVDGRSERQRRSVTVSKKRELAGPKFGRMTLTKALIQRESKAPSKRV